MAHHAFLSLTIENGRHFPSLHLDFSERMNVLIGPRGTGKPARAALRARRSAPAELRGARLA
jgi:predicted ATPase